MAGFIDDHREKFGIEPICAVLPIAPSLYYELKARERDPHRRPARARRDEKLCEHVRRVWRENRAAKSGSSSSVRSRSSPRYGGAPDAAPGSRGGGAWAEVHGDDDRGYRGDATAGSGNAAVPGSAAESAVGCRSDVRCHVARVRVCGVRHRRILASDRRLASVELAAQRPGPRCGGAGTLRSSHHPGGAAGASQRSGRAGWIQPVVATPHRKASYVRLRSRD